MSGDTSHHSHPHAQVVRIVRGEPSDEEIAALAAVVIGLTGAEPMRVPSPESDQRSGWGNRAPRLRTPVHPGPGAWHASTLPH